MIIFQICLASSVSMSLPSPNMLTIYRCQTDLNTKKGLLNKESTLLVTPYLFMADLTVCWSIDRSSVRFYSWSMACKVWRVFLGWGEVRPKYKTYHFLLGLLFPNRKRFNRQGFILSGEIPNFITCIRSLYLKFEVSSFKTCC